MWNDTDLPLGYLITFRSYGTWLHGDARGSIDRFHNRYRSPYIPPNPRWQDHNKRSLRSKPLILNAAQRRSVINGIQEVCAVRQWYLHAVNIRTNHVHSVVSIGLAKPERALATLKSYATRHLRSDGNWTQPQSPWAEKGSKKRLWNERSIAMAVDYVLYGQGEDLPDFD